MTPDTTGNAERQRRYRAARRDADGPAEQRLDLHIALPARMALRRLAKHHGLSQKTALEQILLAAQDTVVNAAADNGAAYYALLEPHQKNPRWPTRKRYPVTPNQTGTHPGPHPKRTPPLLHSHQPAGGEFQ